MGVAEVDCVDLNDLAGCEMDMGFPDFGNALSPRSYYSTPLTEDEIRDSMKQQKETVVIDCPKCGSILVKRIRKSDGKAFYGCSEYFTTGCKGSMDLESYADAILEVSGKRR